MNEAETRAGHIDPLPTPSKFLLHQAFSVQS